MLDKHTNRIRRILMEWYRLGQKETAKKIFERLEEEIIKAENRYQEFGELVNIDGIVDKLKEEFGVDDENMD